MTLAKVKKGYVVLTKTSLVSLTKHDPTGWAQLPCDGPRQLRRGAPRNSSCATPLSAAVESWAAASATARLRGTL